MKNTAGERKGRPGAVRQGSKGKQLGSGGQGRQALEGKKPTPKAEDRPYHPAGKRKAASERYEAAGGRARDSASARPQASAAPRAKAGSSGGAPQSSRPRSRNKTADESEVVTGRNSVLEALRAKIPATALYIATRIEVDDRVKEVLNLANSRGLPVLEIGRASCRERVFKDV